MMRNAPVVSFITLGWNGRCMYTVMVGLFDFYRSSLSSPSQRLRTRQGLQSLAGIAP